MKDTVAVKGFDYCIGYSSLAGKPVKYDSPLTRILKDMGMIPYVKTNVPITLLSFESTNDVRSLPPIRRKKENEEQFLPLLSWIYATDTSASLGLGKNIKSTQQGLFSWW